MSFPLYANIIRVISIKDVLLIISLFFQIVNVLLNYTSVDVNAINNQRETAMDLADKLQYGESSLEIKEALIEAGAKHARHVGKVDEAMELKKAVSDIKHEVHSQFIQNEKTNRRFLV